MANRLNIPADLEQLVEKREKDRRQPETTDAEIASKEARQRNVIKERRSGSGRRAEDRQ